VKNFPSQQALRKLKSLLGKRLLTQEECLVYTYDSSLRGIWPLAVALPEKKEEVIEILKIAEDFKIPVTPRGAGTSTTGSSLSHKNGIVISFTRMNRILELNQEERIVKVEPGVVNKQLKDFLKPYGLFYPPDPASYAFSTIGGNVATAAGGPRGLKYGTTKDYVLDIEVVLPGGRLFHTGRPVLKQAVNYNLTSLMIGSEGTLGVFTEITLKLLPLPEKRMLFVSFHQLEEEPLSVISALLLKGLTPCCAEFVDKTSLKALYKVKKDKKFKNTQAMLFLELDGRKEEVKKDSEIVEKILNSLKIPFFKAEEEKHIEELWELRREISPATKVLGKFKISNDVVVPRSQMKTLLKTVRKIEEEVRLPILCFGHAGDGNFHINIMHNEEDKGLAELARKKIIQKVWKLGGTFSGEHGVGYTKRFFAKKELSPLEIEIMKKIKQAFDPFNLLNPEVKIP